MTAYRGEELVMVGVIGALPADKALREGLLLSAYFVAFGLLVFILSFKGDRWFRPTGKEHPRQFRVGPYNFPPSRARDLRLMSAVFVLVGVVWAVMTIIQCGGKQGLC